MTSRDGVVTWVRLARTYQKIQRAASAQLRPFGLSLAQFDVLAQVGAREGISQQELSEALLVTKGNVCQLVDRMERAGWLARRPSGRVNALYLTDRGRTLFAAVVPAHETWLATRLGALAPAEHRQLRGLLRQVALEPHPLAPSSSTVRSAHADNSFCRGP